MNRRIIGREIVADIRAGMRDSQLKKKYSLSSRDLRGVYRQLKLEREARIAEIVTDLMKGLSQSYVMSKHQISARTLNKILHTLSSGQMSELSKIGEELPQLSDDVMIDFRRKERYRPLVKIMCWDHKSGVGECLLRDISEDGLSLVGSQARVNEVTQIAILGDETGLVVPFELEAECKWRETDADLGQPVSGFRIVNISTENSARLMELVENHTDRP